MYLVVMRGIKSNTFMKGGLRVRVRVISHKSSPEKTSLVRTHSSLGLEDVRYVDI